MKRLILLFLAAMFLLNSGIAQPSLKLERAFLNLTFSQPTYLTSARDSTDRIFVVERVGRVYVFPNLQTVTLAERKVFLDLTDRVESRVFGSGENGMFSIVFHPNYAENRKLYVSYTDTMAGVTIRDTIHTGQMMSRVSEFLVSETNPDSVDPSSERILIEFEQPWDNHNGGQIAFGPEGYLYMSFGDGRAPRDTLRNAQKLTHWFATMLRIDVDSTDPGLEYRIPPDNPFVGNAEGWKEEIFAHGFRNPWRFSFDRESGMLWLADVGEKRAEEINIVQSGKNYGWSIMEGIDCFREDSCDTTGLTLPIFEYTREGKQSPISITGGYVYRGPTYEALQGLYLYSDYGNPTIWALEYEDGEVQSNISITTSPQRIASFGEDDAGEIYVVGYSGTGSFVYRFVENPLSSGGLEGTGVPTIFKLYPAYPNPFNPSTRIAFDLPRSEHVTVAIYDIQGNIVLRLVNRRYESGRHSISWDGKDALGRISSSGVYLYSLEAGPFRQTGKMVLLK